MYSCLVDELAVVLKLAVALKPAVVPKTAIAAKFVKFVTGCQCGLF